MKNWQMLIPVVSVCVLVASLSGCRSLREDLRGGLRQAMNKEPASTHSDSQWTTHSTSTQAVPSVGSPNHGDFGAYSQPVSGERPYHTP